MENRSKVPSEPIAIIGMSCRYPKDCNNTEEFWKLLVEGQEGIGPIPRDRLEKGIISPEYKYQRGNYLNLSIDEFDARFFEMGPKTAQFMDPQLRLLMEVTWEALEDSSVNPHSLRNARTGIFIGAWLQDYQKIGLLSPEKDFFLVYMGRSMAARLAFFLGTTGYAVDLESACSSSMAAIDIACKSLRDKSVDTCIVGGVNLLLEPPFPTYLDVGFATCDDGRCKPFDASANGYGRAEGCGVIVLKRLSDAIKDDNNILAVIRGSAITQEGLSRSMGTPTVRSESLAMQLALKDAGVDPSEVSYVETHGTGTQVGDIIEMKAIQKVYGSSERKDPLVIGTVKANVGHSEASSGVTSLIKAVLALKNEVIPKHINFTKLNPEIDMSTIPAILPMVNMKWLRHQGRPRICGVSSFGISGTDGHLIVEEAPPQIKKGLNEPKLERPLSLMVISAKTRSALEKFLKNYEEFFSKTTERFNDIAYSSNTTRALFDHRAILIAQNTASALSNLDEGKYLIGKVPLKDKHKICFVFPGQGSQYHGMAKELYSYSPTFKFHFDKCCEILREEENEMDLKRILWGCDTEQLNSSVNSQIAIVCVNFCIFKFWESLGILPDYVLGHSLGESSAIIATGVRDLRSGLKAVLLKTKSVDKLAKGKMIAVRMDQVKAEQLRQEFLTGELKKVWLDMAAVNSSEQIVFSGESEVVQRFHQFCQGKKVKSVIIASSHAFHSRALDPALPEIRKGIEEIHKQMEPNYQTSIKYISSSEARVMKNTELLDPSYWVRNTRNTVNFMDASNVALEEGCKIFLEIGSQPILSTFVKRNTEHFGFNQAEVICLPSLKRNKNDWEVILSSLGQLMLTTRGNEIDWKKFDEIYGPRNKVALPFYPFIKKCYWIDKSKLINSDSGIRKNLIHPLIDARIENPTKVQIYQKMLTLEQEKNLNYLTNHRIANHIIFPAAAFLEMCVATSLFSHGSGKGDTNYNFSLQNLIIKTPLRLEKDKKCLMQTTFDTLPNERQSIKIFSKEKREAGDYWIEHCTTFYNAPKTTSTEFLLNYDLNFMKNNWNPDSPTNIENFYRIELPEGGMNFGPMFQNLKMVWRENGGKNILVLVLTNLEDSIEITRRSYLMHPLISDSMIQTTLLFAKEENPKLTLPIKIEKFSMGLRNQLDQKMYYVLCMKRMGEDDLFDVHLLNQLGTVLAMMEGLHMFPTNFRDFETRMGISGAKDHLPQLFEETWKSCKLGCSSSSTYISPKFKSKSTWLIFTNDKEILEIEAKIRLMNRIPITVLQTHTESSDSKKRTFEALDTHSNSIEGILYLNGLSEDEDCQQKLCEPLLYICQWLQEHGLGQDQPIKLAVVTQGTQIVLDSDVVYNPAPSTLWGIAKTFKNENPSAIMKCIDLPAKVSIGKIKEGFAREIFNDAEWKEDTIALRNNENERYTTKLTSVNIKDQQAEMTSEENKPLFKYRGSTYIITGGLRGLGFQVATWMLENGARNLILVGRSEPKPEIIKQINSWNKLGKKVNAFKADVSNVEECTTLFDWIKDRELPPVRGIFHCAGILADGIISNQTWSNFETVFDTKVHGSWNLHKLSLFYKLDFFVMFSSISAQFGIPGQSNYAAGNCYEDALMRYRHSLGLPGITMNFGPWEEVGMASKLQFPGLKSIKIEQGLSSLEYALKENRRQLTVATFNSFHEFAKLCPRTLNYVSEELLNSEAVEPPSSSSSKSLSKNHTLTNSVFLKEMEAATKHADKIQVIENFIGSTVKRVLNTDNDDDVDYYSEFDKLGIDSLMSLELRSELQIVFGKRLTVTSAQIRDFPTVSSLAEKLAGEFV